MHVTDTADAGQGEQVSVEEGFDRRLLGGRIQTSSQQGLVDFDIRRGGLIEQRQQAVEGAGRDIRCRKGGEVRTRGLDREGVIIEPDRSVAFAQDGHAQTITAQLMGQC